MRLWLPYPYLLPRIYRDSRRVPEQRSWQAISLQDNPFLCDLPFACPVESPTWILKRALRKPGYIAQVPRTFSFWEFRRSSRKPTAFIDYSPSRGNVS